jgi:hypothetical protein
MRTITTTLSLGLCLLACDAPRTQPAGDERAAAASAGEPVASPRFGADQKEGELTVLDLKKKGCSELLALGERDKQGLSVEVSLALPREADQATLSSVRERVVPVLPEQPSHLEMQGTAMQLTTSQAGVRALCGSSDTRLVRPVRLYEPL